MKALVFALLLTVPAPVAAQSMASTPPADAPALNISLGTRVGMPMSGYEDGGRRDPFASLVMPKRTSSGAVDGRARTGLGALALADVSVRGIVKSGTTMLAILEVPGKQSFVARVKDRLLDASIQSIDVAGVVFAEAGGSGTPLQVRKALRSGEEVR